MFVNGYDFDTRVLEFERVDLATCFPDQPEELETARAALTRSGQYVAGGGAAKATLLLVCPVVEKTVAGVCQS
ncbi:MAG: hypothetical protein AB7I42_26515 [Bradyrhizobium sp.]|uniref:hypothetical protein n=1 Tax=Bradyrhizobium sp. TaxID=376 RepID=UPI003D0CDB09